MKLKTLAFNAAIAGAVAVGSVATTTPTHAATITSGGFVIDSPTTATATLSDQNINLNFAGITDFGFIGRSGDFVGATAASDGIKVSNLLITPSSGTFTPNSFQNFSAVANPNPFITGIKLSDGTDVVFKLLSSSIAGSFGNADGTGAINTFSLGGILNGEFIQPNVIGAQGTVASLRIDSSNGSNIRVAVVPTPALLPGLIGFGVAAVRKRKKQATAQAEAETAQV